MQTTGQDRTHAALGGRRESLGSGMGVLSLVLNQTEQQQSGASSCESFVRCSAQHQEGPSRSCSATKSHGAARQLTMGTASLAYINNNPALFFRVMLPLYVRKVCLRLRFIRRYSTISRHRESSRPLHRSFSLHTEESELLRQVHAPLQSYRYILTPQSASSPGDLLFLVAARICTYVGSYTQPLTHCASSHTPLPCQLQLLC